MKYYTRVGGTEREYEFAHDGDALVVQSNGTTCRVVRTQIGDGTVFSLLIDDRAYDCLVDFVDGKAVVQVLGERVEVEVEDDRERAARAVSAAKSGGKRTVEAAMPGVVVSVDVAEGDLVEDGQTLVVLDAMKMQNPIGADGAGRVERVHVKVGETVSSGDPLVELGDPESGE